ncbi:MAG: isoleucine--tRNA ligase [Candidatus Woesearchaeota archaeon]
MASYNFKEVEAEILKFWEDNNIYKNVKKKGHGKEKFYWLQGPPYTSGRMHLGTAWNSALKDELLRYKRMRGFDVWDRGGYDMHGLPIESKVQKKFNLHTKHDITNFGLEKFSHECFKFAEEGASIMSQDMWNMGIWINNDNAYMPIRNTFIEGEWFLIKKAHDKNRLYKGNKVMTWCKSCETAVAKHELEYKNVKDNSIFVKFKVLGKEDEYLIIWTTTPWTIPFNLAVMVNPELDYLKAKVLVDEKNSKHETWIVSSALAGAFIRGVANKQFTVLEEFKGEKLLGVEYVHPFNEYMPYSELKKHSKNVHTVILSEEYVDTSSGTGLVHCAPGCGPEDFEVGKKYGIPAFNNIDELGVFPDETKRFSGMTAKTDDGLFIDILREMNAIIETTYVEHEYAHCQRCHNPVVFRLTNQWFFKTEDLKDRMIGFNNDIYWYPETAKNAFDSWLRNLKDNSITKQRFWGTPVPIWVCSNDKCNKYDVIGSIEELQSKSIHTLPNNLHKPWIDSVQLKCSCGHTMDRIPDVLDVWIDAGTTSWNCLDYPRQTELFDKYFPADFIIEGKDQIRGWFNLLMVASTLALDRPAFKNVSMHGFITDVEGEKMSKSLGNIISPSEIISKHGADTLRYYSIDIAIGDDMSFSWGEIGLKYKNLLILWNLHNFLIDFKENNNLKLVKNPVLGDEERYMLSRLHSTIKNLTDELDKYHLNATPRMVESLYMDLSRVYIQLIRDKSVIGSDDEKEAILYTLYQTLLGVLKLFSIVAPFITEKIYLNLKEHFDLPHESIHAFDWPTSDSSKIDVTLEKGMDDVLSVVQAALSCRDKMNLGVRWPLSELVVDSNDVKIKDLIPLIIKQVNVKKVVLKNMDVQLNVKPNFKTLGKDFGNNTHKVAELIAEHALIISEHIKANKAFEINGFSITSNHVVIEKICPDNYLMAEVQGGAVYLNKSITSELELEGYAREIVRRIQQLRKDSGLNKKDVIDVFIKTELKIDDYQDMILEKVGARKILLQDNTFNKFDAQVNETIKGKEVFIGFNKV